MSSILPWSFSSWSNYQTCPKKHYETRIAKNFVEAESDAMLWGNEVHAALEKKIKHGTPLPERMARIDKISSSIISSKSDETYAELKLAVTEELVATEFFADDAWARGIIDLLKITGDRALVLDWKTGKRKPNSKQLDLMTVLVYAKYPAIEKISTVFMWFQEPTKPTIKHYTRDQMEELIHQFDDGVADMLYSEANNAWPARPSGLCYGWCPVTTCPHWRPKRNR